ncbi:MAG: hypothetical protein SGI77_10750 [Pirellulaceae bacterium]|nr:hypothetical protein [Pirellulaceae bacterium]
MRIVSIVGRLAVFIQKRFLSRMWIAIATKAETNFFEALRIGNQVCRDVIPARTVVLLSREEAIMRVAENVLMRSVRTSLPTLARTRVIDNLKAMLFKVVAVTESPKCCPSSSFTFDETDAICQRPFLVGKNRRLLACPGTNMGEDNRQKYKVNRDMTCLSQVELRIK